MEQEEEGEYILGAQVVPRLQALPLVLGDPESGADLRLEREKRILSL